MQSRAPSLTDTSKDAMQNLVFVQRHVTNPFGEQAYALDSLQQATRGIAENFGQVENGHCASMRDDLVELDRSGSGFVPLGVFYQDKSERRFQFVESVDYLRGVGALEEQPGRQPRVRIANYIV